MVCTRRSRAWSRSLTSRWLTSYSKTCVSPRDTPNPPSPLLHIHVRCTRRLPTSGLSAFADSAAAAHPSRSSDSCATRRRSTPTHSRTRSRRQPLPIPVRDDYPWSYRPPTRRRCAGPTLALPQLVARCRPMACRSFWCVCLRVLTKAHHETVGGSMRAFA
jgi:hypothetical protein